MISPAITCSLHESAKFFITTLLLLSKLKCRLFVSAVGFFQLVALTDRFVMNNRASKNIGLRRNNKLWLDTIIERCAFVPQC